MRRRTLLTAVGAGCVALGGCLRDDGDSADRTTKPTSTPASGPTGAVPVGIQNQRDTSETVTVTVTSGPTTVFEEAVELAAGESVTLDSGLDETGEEYELVAETADGRRDTFPFTIEEYDLQNRSKLLVWITEDRLDTGMQE